MAEILLFSEDAGLLAQLVAGADEVVAATGWEVASYGLPEQLTSTADPCDARDTAGLCVQALTAAATKGNARLVLVGATKLGMEVAPRITERLGAGYGAWATAVVLDGSSRRIRATCMLYAGVGEAEYVFEEGTVVLTVGDGAFDAGERAVTVGVPLETAETTSPLRVLGCMPKPGRANDLEHSRLVVDCGKGVATLEDLEWAKSLAESLGGRLACSRPLASDRDWFSDWLGLSGARVKPDLCLTVGISGSVQHVIGIRGAGLIAAVNTDEDAPIFSQADLGVVADLREFLPALLKRIQERDVQPAWNTGAAAPASPSGATLGKEV